MGNGAQVFCFCFLNLECITKSGRSYIKLSCQLRRKIQHIQCAFAHTFQYLAQPCASSLGISGKWLPFPLKEGQKYHNKKGIKFSVDGYASKEVVNHKL